MLLIVWMPVDHCIWGSASEAVCSPKGGPFCVRLGQQHRIGHQSAHGVPPDTKAQPQPPKKTMSVHKSNREPTYAVGEVRRVFGRCVWMGRWATGCVLLIAFGGRRTARKRGQSASAGCETAGSSTCQAEAACAGTRPRASGARPCAAASATPAPASAACEDAAGGTATPSLPPSASAPAPAAASAPCKCCIVCRWEAQTRQARHIGTQAGVSQP